MKKFLKLITSRMFLSGVLMLVQFAVLVLGIYFLSDRFPLVYAALILLALCFTIYLVSADMNPSYKISWIVVVLALPLFGVVSYLLFGRNDRKNRRFRRYFRAARETVGQLGEEEGIEAELSEADPFYAKTSRYVLRRAGYPVYRTDDVTYFPCGEDFLPAYLEELSRARKYIFLEYFIVDGGEFWSQVLAILRRKAEEGVDVRMIYDDCGNFMTLPSNYYKTLEGYGIRTMVFNPFRPVLDMRGNNRTHRKITVIDGVTAFTGGLNIADEYVNKRERFGYWKDTAVRVRGKAVESFAAMFLQFWSIRYPDDPVPEPVSESETEEAAGPERVGQVPEKAAERVAEAARETAETETERAEKGAREIAETEKLGTERPQSFAQPYSDAPLSGENICENLYLSIIYNAKKYVYITTPYLLIDHEMKVALLSAARCGVDVRIIVPHVPDKKITFWLTKAFYTELAAGGVKVYEYLPGFIHAKGICSDGEYAIVGTSNMDFRSFYLQFECGVFFKNRALCEAMTRDAEEVSALSREVTKENAKVRLPMRVIRGVLRLFAPMM